MVQFCHLKHFMPIPSASSKNIFTVFKFFFALSIFFEHSQIVWSWSKARFYLINLHIWAWSKVFEHIQNILNTIKNIWTWSKNIWTSRWIRHVTCLWHRKLQNFWIRILQIFCYDFFAWSKVGCIAPESRNLF